MNKRAEFLGYVQTAVILRYCKFKDCTHEQAIIWALECLKSASDVADKIPPSLSPIDAASQFLETEFHDLRNENFAVADWLKQTGTVPTTIANR